MKRKIAVIAFGGNAILPSRQRGLQTEQMSNARKAARLMIHVVKKGYDLIIVHGNGPQVGNLLIQMEEAINKIPPFSLEVCDAMTEGSMGFMLEKAIINELRKGTAGIPGATKIQYFKPQAGPGGAAIEIRVVGDEFPVLQEIAD